MLAPCSFLCSRTRCRGDALIAPLAGTRICPHRSFNQTLAMADILYILLSIGFFGLMIAFIWGCEKI